MAKDEDSASRAGRKRSAEREPRFRFRREQRPEPPAQLPDPGQAKLLVDSLDDGLVSISVVDGAHAGAVSHINPAKVFSSDQIDKEAIHALAQQFSIQDFALLRAVLAVVAYESRASVNFAVSSENAPELEFGATHEEYDLLCKVDELSHELGCVLRELASRAAGHRRSAVKLFAYRLVDERLLEALDRCGRKLSGIDVTECTQLPERPLDGRKRRVVEVLAWGWPSLTGAKPSPYNGRFHEFVGHVCRLVELKAVPSRSAVAGWLKEKSREREDLNKPANDGD